MYAKDSITREAIGGVRFPKLKGHVAIRLHNPTTGKTEIIEGDNMITNAVKDIFASNFCGALDYRKMLPLYSKMFGGVLLFGDVLDTTSEDAADDYFIPTESATPVIAHAGQNVYTSQADDPKRGNPLDTSMVVNDGVVTLAWEWGSGGGNGVIKSLGLTHADVGDAGTGSTSNAFKAMTPNINASFGIGASTPIWFIDNAGYGYNFSCSGTNVTITKFPIAYEDVGLVGQAYAYIAGVQKSKTVSIGTTINDFPYYFFDKSTNKLYLFYNTSSSSSVEVNVLNLSNWNSITNSHATWSLQTAVGPLYSWTGGIPINIPFYNGYVYLPKGVSLSGGQGRITGYLRVNLNSTADQTLMEANCQGPSGVFVPNKTNRILTGKSFVINGNNLYPTAVDTPDVINTYNGSSRLENACVDSGVGLAQAVYLHKQYSPLYYVSASKFYLGTKFNLDSPVTKTASQSMTVTYTLTEVA